MNERQKIDSGIPSETGMTESWKISPFGRNGKDS